MNTFDYLIQAPATFDDAVDLLSNILDANQLAMIAAHPKTELVDLHLSIGMFIRNVLQLHNKKNLLAKLGEADDLSMELLHALWERHQSVHVLNGGS